MYQRRGYRNDQCPLESHAIRRHVQLQRRRIDLAGVHHRLVRPGANADRALRSGRGIGQRPGLRDRRSWRELRRSRTLQLWAFDDCGVVQPRHEHLVTRALTERRPRNRRRCRDRQHDLRRWRPCARRRCIRCSRSLQRIELDHPAAVGLDADGTSRTWTGDRWNLSLRNRRQHASRQHGPGRNRRAVRSVRAVGIPLVDTYANARGWQRQRSGSSERNDRRRCKRSDESDRHIRHRQRPVAQRPADARTARIDGERGVARRPLAGRRNHQRIACL